MDIKIQFNKMELNDLKSYCDLNGLDIGETIKKCYLSGFNIEKYGILNKKSSTDNVVEKIVEKIVIKEVPVEKIILKEVVKEVPVDKIIIKEVENKVIQSGVDSSKFNLLQDTNIKLREQIISLEKTLLDCQSKYMDVVNKLENKVVGYLKSSNLDDNLY